MKTSYYIVIGMLSIVLTGCDSRQSAESWDLVATSNGLVYRINKKTGDVYLIDGAEITKLIPRRPKQAPPVPGLIKPEVQAILDEYAPRPK